VPSRLEALARRVTDDPFFLGSALADYARSEGLDDAGLAAALGCSGEALARLRLCRRPDAAPERFWDQVVVIAHRFGARPDVIAEAVRRADALAGLREPAVSERGLLMAARDRAGDREDLGIPSQSGVAPAPADEGEAADTAEPAPRHGSGPLDPARDEETAHGSPAGGEGAEEREGRNER
jgi:hypothetical protein